jgi:aryl-alcohol dehydrogenase-like predicted oxidoreductase
MVFVLLWWILAAVCLQVLGKALKDLPRDKIIVSTKVRHHTPEMPAAA